MTDGRTHWHGCHTEHHDCALALLDEAKRLLREAHAHVPTTGDDDLDVRIYSFFEGSAIHADKT